VRKKSAMPNRIHFPSIGKTSNKIFDSDSEFLQNSLETRFKQSRYLSVGERTKLAQTLNLSETQVWNG
jgi:hypothetical protein